MADNQFKLALVTPKKRVLTDELVEEVMVPAYRGELNILPGHAPMVTTLATGIMRYRLAGEKDFKQAAISWGYCEVSPGAVSILAETIERPEELDLDRIRRSREEAEQMLERDDLSEEDYQKYHNKLVKARVREDLAQINGAS